MFYQTVVHSSAMLCCAKCLMVSQSLNRPSAQDRFEAAEKHAAFRTIQRDPQNTSRGRSRYVCVCQNRDSEPRNGFGASFVFPEMVSVFLLCVEMGIRSPEMAFGVPVVFPVCVEMGIRSPESAPVVFPVCVRVSK